MGLWNILFIAFGVMGLLILVLLFYKGVIKIIWLKWVLSMAIIFIIGWGIFKLNNIVLSDHGGY